MDLQRKKMTQINTIINESRDITTDTTEIQRLIRNYKFDNLEEMGKSLGTYPYQKWIVEKLDRPITSNMIELLIKNLPTNKNPGPDSFTGEFY